MTPSTGRDLTEFVGGDYRLNRSPSGWNVIQVSTKDPARRVNCFRGTKEECQVWIIEHSPEVSPTFEQMVTLGHTPPEV